MSEVVFNFSKAIGINWTMLKWPYIKLNSPFYLISSCGNAAALDQGVIMDIAVLLQILATLIDLLAWIVKNTNWLG